jgi:hypothetical protein
MTNTRRKFLDDLYIAVVAATVGAMTRNDEDRSGGYEMIASCADEQATAVIIQHLGNNEDDWGPGEGEYDA